MHLRCDIFSQFTFCLFSFSNFLGWTFIPWEFRLLSEENTTVALWISYSPRVVFLVCACVRLSGLFIWVCFGWIVLFPRFCLKMDHPSSLFFGTFQTLQHIALWFLAVKTIIQWKDPSFISWVGFYYYFFSLSMSSFYNS